jgi:PAS domain S-box-containing protein
MTFQYTPYTGPLVASALVAAVSGIYVGRSSDRPPVTWYVVAMIGLTFWPATLAAGLSTQSVALKRLLLGAHVAFAGITSIYWGVFCLYYTGRTDWVSRRRHVLIAGVVGVFVAVLGASPLHELVFVDPAIETRDGIDILTYGVGPVYWLWTAVVWSFFLVGNATLVRKFYRTRNVYRKYTALLLVSGWSVWLGTASSFFQFSPLPHLMLGPLIFLFWGAVGTPAAASIRFLQLFPLDTIIGLFSSGRDDLVPLARDYVVEEMKSGILILDTEGNIVDVNAMGKKMLGTSERTVGRRIDEVVDVDSYFDGDLDADTLREQIWVEADSGEQRCYDVSISTITGDSGDEVGRAVVMNDITDQKEKERALREREQELQTLKQVYSRILRHNIRNDMNVIRGHAEWIGVSADDAVAERAANIVETADDLASTSKKTQVVDEVVGTESELVECDVRSLVRNSLMGIHEEFPDADVRTDVPADLVVRGNTYLSAAIENAVENAIRYNDSDAPVVEIRASDVGDVVELEIRDNGPGIPEQELEAIASGEETALVHTSGIGLWLIDWILRNSGGEVDFSNCDDGLVITMELQRAR